jgi:hypothetical protein
MLTLTDRKVMMEREAEINAVKALREWIIMKIVCRINE